MPFREVLAALAACLPPMLAAASVFAENAPSDETAAYQAYHRAAERHTGGDLNGAIAEYTRAIALGLDFPTIYNSRALAKEGRGDLDGALADFNKAIELDPKLALAYGNRAALEKRRGDFRAVLADLDRLVELDPVFAPALND
ncbi:MAG TPA: tetratricopeptide repeat protein, partial [Chthoniobacteraceae bacterium]